MNRYCCGKRLLEIKCTYKHRNSHPHRIEDSSSFLVKGDDGEIHLSAEHDYHFLIQGQLAVCDLYYCDLVCWTLLGLHYERVVADHDHFIEEVKPGLDTFFVSVLLPRLLTGSMSGSTAMKQAAQAHIPDTYYWCNGKDEGKMVACDNDSCERQLFHFECEKRNAIQCFLMNYFMIFLHFLVYYCTSHFCSLKHTTLAYTCTG